MKVEEQMKVNFKRLEDDLHLNKHSTLWVKQFVEDLRLLKHIEAGE